MVPFKLNPKQFRDRYARNLERIAPRAIGEIRSLIARPVPDEVKTADVEIFVSDDDPYVPAIWIYYRGENNKVDRADESIHSGRSFELMVGLDTLDEFDERFFTDERFGGLDLIADALKAWFAECWWKAGGWSYSLPVALAVHDGYGEAGVIKLTDRAAAH